jgi:PST family polysaccharide transporter
MKGTRSLLLTGALWIGSANIIANSLGFISTIILARLLVPEDFGLVAVATALLTIIFAITEMPLSQALVQHDDPKDAHFHTAWTMSALRAAFLGILIAAISHPLSRLYGDARLEDIFLVVAVSVVISGLASPKLVMFQRNLLFHQAFALRVTEKIVGFIVAVSLAFAFRTYWALVLGSLASQVTSVAVSYLISPYRPRFNLSCYKELLSFSVWITLGNWVQTANWRADPLLLGYLLPVGLLGQYSMGNRVSALAVRGLAQPVQQTLFPALSRLKADPQRLKQGYLRAQGVLCLWVLPLGFGFAALATEIVELALGAKWALAIPVIQIVAVTMALQMTINLQPMAMATGNTRLLFGRDLRTFVIRWPLIILGLYLGRGSDFGMLIGAILGRSAAGVLNTIWNMTLVSQISKVSVTDQLGIAWRPAICAATMALIVYLAKSEFPASGTYLENSLWAAGLVALGFTCYVALLASLWLASGQKNGAEMEAVSILSGVLEKLKPKTK